ncbi:hypothetical protein NC651_002247 [Populus alba x Populus x berolinensis]|nr:hypothetical protein NC651_002247 [Populus alba x Populus x berolinensis]
MDGRLLLCWVAWCTEKVHRHMRSSEMPKCRSPNINQEWLPNKKSSIMERVGYFPDRNTSVTDVESHSSAICGRKSFLPHQLYAIDWVISISYLVIVMLIYKHFIIDNTKQWRCRRWANPVVLAIPKQVVLDHLQPPSWHLLQSLGDQHGLPLSMTFQVSLSYPQLDEGPEQML